NARADYNGHAPNCNVALPTFDPATGRVCRIFEQGNETARFTRKRVCNRARLPRTGGPANGAPQRIAAMAKDPTPPPRRKPAPPGKAGRSGDALASIAAALDRLAPVAPTEPDFDAAHAFVWHPDGRRLVPVPKVNRVAM